MAAFVTDTFTDTNATALDAHTPDVGDAWVVFGDTSSQIQSNKVQGATFGTSWFVNDAAADSDDYLVEADIEVVDPGWGNSVSVLARVPTSDDAYGYEAEWNAGEGEWRLTVWNSGATTLLDSYADAGFLSGTKHVTLICTGDSIQVLIDDVLRMSATDSTWTDGGFVGFKFVGGLDTAVLLDNFNAESGATPPTTTHYLTGRGFEVVDEPAWLSVAVSGMPYNLSFGNAEPKNWYHVGMLSWGTANGAMTAHPVTRELELIQLPAGMTTLWYEFADGVTATVVELAAP